MSTNRLFNLLVAVTLVTMALLTIQAGVATSQVSAGPQSAAVHLTGIDGDLRLNLHDPRQITNTQALVASAPNTSGHTLSQQTRDAIRARWLARFGDTHRTCVLLCGGR